MCLFLLTFHFRFAQYSMKCFEEEPQVAEGDAAALFPSDLCYCAQVSRWRFIWQRNPSPKEMYYKNISMSPVCEFQEIHISLPTVSSFYFPKICAGRDGRGLSMGGNMSLGHLYVESWSQGCALLPCPTSRAWKDCFCCYQLSVIYT